MLIRLARHGLTAWNLERRYIGLRDVPLCESGKARLRAESRGPARVYVSPLRRCLQTARILFPDASLTIVPGLREMDFGAFEGRTAREMEGDPDYAEWVAGGCLGRCPGGERWSDYARRVCDVFRRLMESARDPLVIVAHGGAQMAIMDRFGPPGRSMWEWVTGNGDSLWLECRDWKGGRDLRPAGRRR